MKQNTQLIKKAGVLFSFSFFVFYISYVARKVKTWVHSQKSITKIWNCTRLQIVYNNLTSEIKTNFLRICLIKWPIKAMPYLVWVSNPLLQHPVSIRLRYLWAQVFQINKVINSGLTVWSVEHRLLILTGFLTLPSPWDCRYSQQISGQIGITCVTLCNKY